MRPPLPPRAVYDRRQLATLLGINVKTVVAMEGRGQLPRPIRLGKLIRFDRDAIHDWLAKGGTARAN
jgi:excisionase family DNA binding protein